MHHSAHQEHRASSRSTGYDSRHTATGTCTTQYLLPCGVSARGVNVSGGADTSPSSTEAEPSVHDHDDSPVHQTLKATTSFSLQRQENFHGAPELLAVGCLVLATGNGSGIHQLVHEAEGIEGTVWGGRSNNKFLEIFSMGLVYRVHRRA